MTRYQSETKRLYGVLDKHLKDTKSDYLVGNKCTIADIAHWGWIAAAGWSDIYINEFPALMAWEERVPARPATERGRHVPERHAIKELVADPQKAKAVEEMSKKWMQSVNAEAQHQK